MLSRVANNFYWMGRYVERTNCIARLLLIQINEMPQDSPDFVSASWEGILKSLQIPISNKNSLSRKENNIKTKKTISDDLLLADAYTLVDHLTFESHHPGSILSCLGLVRENARQNQEKITRLVWPHINKTYLRIKKMQLVDLWPDKIIDLYKEVLEFSYLFYGLVQDSLYQDEAVHFIQMGRYLERFQNTSALFENHIHFMLSHKEEEADLIGLLLRCGAFDNYRQVNSLDLTLRKSTNFLLYSNGFSGSLKFCNNKLKESLSSIQEKKDFNISIYQLLDEIENKLHKTHFKHQSLVKFLNSLYQTSVEIDNTLNEVYLNQKNFNAVVRSDQ